MTDINNWFSTIHRKKSDPYEDNLMYNRNGSHGSCEYIMIPMDTGGYQIGNLLWLITMHPDNNTGDWYNEVINVIIGACIKEKIIPYSNAEPNDKFNEIVNQIKNEIKNETKA